MQGEVGNGQLVIIGYLSLPNMVIWCFLLLGVSVVSVQVLGQPSTDGFISIDCGIPDGYTYKDAITNIPYVSDGQFIDTGTSYNISASFMEDTLPRQQATLRSFPSGARNCYTLKPVMQHHKYLIRATFTYGNYDGLYGERPDIPILFDLHIGVNLWKSINISDASGTHSTEVMTIASADFISVCLINKGSGTPFISSLELRPLKNTTYKAANDLRSLVLYTRRNLGTTTDDILRFPDDGYDRRWIPVYDLLWTNISTTFTVRNRPDDPFEAPSAVMQTAATPAVFNYLGFYWDSEGEDTLSEYYLILHISELQSLTRNDTRQFDVSLNGKLWSQSFTPDYLQSDALSTVVTGYRQYDVSLYPTTTSTLPPILNALEIYSIRPLLNFPTDIQDVDAIMSIKERYRVKKNWMGDPCTPKAYAWDGVNCNASMIIAINLSSSGLTGVIVSSFAQLKAIENLDLSYNNLTGPVPDFLADLPSLQVLNLTGNHFNGTIPDALRSKRDKGLLVLSIEDDINPCNDENSCPSKKNKKKITAAIIVILSVVVVALLLVLMFTVWRRQRVKGMTAGSSTRPGSEDCSGQKMDCENYPPQFESRQFTHMQLVNITNNFVRVIGRGGFGMVYHGYLENGTEVVVKMHSESSSQGSKEFLAEAQNLTRIHHRNLVSLVGYCKDGNDLALIYEYMPQGSLQDHLNGKSKLGRALGWRERLQIALEAAQGLEYLHKGCKPPITHGDVKTSNILLGKDLEAKIADFGLSRAFHGDTHTRVSSATLVGTPGYVDPEYHNSFRLNEKSDVYGYGVVLLELITGQPPLPPGLGGAHIVQRVASKLARGNIDDIVDARLRGEYDGNSAWKVVQVSMKCTGQASTQRPTMSDVVIQLKEILALANKGIDVSQDGAFEIVGPYAR